MKRSREVIELDSIRKMANFLVLLSRGGDVESLSHSASRVFECKTCKRRFMSFQALGGHRASHKKPRLMEENRNDHSSVSVGSPAKPKTHECSICGSEFATGQALGGHMRRHRASVHENTLPLNLLPTTPALKRSNSKRVFGVDLNLPPQEHDFEFRLGIIYG